MEYELTLRRVGLGFTFEFNLNEGVFVLFDNSEGPVLHVSLDIRIIETTTNQTLSIEDGVFGVHGSLVLGSITNETLLVRESDIGGSSTVTLLVGNDFNTFGFPDTNTRITKAYSLESLATHNYNIRSDIYVVPKSIPMAPSYSTDIFYEKERGRKRKARLPLSLIVLCSP